MAIWMELPKFYTAPPATCQTLSWARSRTICLRLGISIANALRGLHSNWFSASAPPAITTKQLLFPLHNALGQDEEEEEEVPQEEPGQEVAFGDGGGGLVESLWMGALQSQQQSEWSATVVTCLNMHSRTCLKYSRRPRSRPRSLSLSSSLTRSSPLLCATEDPHLPQFTPLHTPTYTGTKNVKC